MSDSPYLISRRKRECFGQKPELQKEQPKPIAKKSAKEKVNHREYKKIVKEMLAEDPNCEIKVPDVCTQLAEGLHHMKRRGSNLLNRKYLKRACNACNVWCENNPVESIELGMSLSVHKI